MKRNITICSRFVLEREKKERLAAEKEEDSIEFLFLGLLKLSEITVENFGSIEYQDQVRQEIKRLEDHFSELGIDTSRSRHLLRRLIAGGAKLSGEAAFLKILEMAQRQAVQEGHSYIEADNLLQAILEQPTDTLLQVCPTVKPEKSVTSEKGAEESEEREKLADEMSLDFLPVLTRRIRSMRATLLKTVHGQDHVVHAFSEGIFAAEVLAASDEKRKRPRAIFVFAGPPGVGKTFLAEQAAEALSLPFKRFDMSLYADQQAYLGLVGFEKSYHEAKPGSLTSFVKEHPHAILLFDEIEKAHLNTLQLFLQILDAGRLKDRYLDQEIVFKDTLIIFTSNAGRSLYEGESRQIAAGVTRKTLLSALETEKNPQTGQPFFPAAITSRMATGWPLLFNHLQPHHLEKISRGELRRLGGLFKKQYGLTTEMDPMISTALLFREGGAADARTLRAQTELFFKNEIFKVCRLFSEEHFSERMNSLKKLRFTLETAGMAQEVRPIFYCDEKAQVLLCGSPRFAERCRKELPAYTFFDAVNAEEALQIAGEKDIRLVLLNPAGIVPPPPSHSGDLLLTAAEEDKSSLKSVAAFDYAPITATLLREGNRLFRALRERLPELPLYLLETKAFPIDAELLLNYVRAGARGKLEEAREDVSIFEDQLSLICRELYLQQVASKMASEHRVLYFETAPRFSEGQSEIILRLRDFSLKRATAADDAGSVLDDVEKPDIQFSDVIGAADAKEELQFFIEFLKQPKKLSAQGLRLPKGVLLYGPPGTGKTMLAKAMAGESDVAFIPAVASAFVTKYQGSGPEAVRELFKKARRYAPAIIFIDEIDAIGRKRGGSNNAHGEEMALNALLNEMDGFAVDPKRPVFVLAATNFDVEEGQGGIGVIDAALARRFDRKIQVELPNAAEREQFIRMILKKNSLHQVSEKMILRLASRSVGMSPANLAAVFELAQRMAVKAQKPLDDALLDEAYELSRHGAKKDWGYEYLERVARHESGHAFLCYLSENTPAYLTIVARGEHGGYMEHAAKEMGPLATREELLSRIRTSLGGRAAEIVYYGEEKGISSGASADLEQATRIAETMICRYGMDEKLGLAVIEAREAVRNPEVIKRVNEMLALEMKNTVALIHANKASIDRLVDALMKKNKLSGEEIEALLQQASAET